ncbi:fumarylacetoacetate hydrolase family protein [Streptomyces mirabilis]|uniref:fumarylacetoacetate hydrolase family protein n=1 Tax=Streptomyces TaxID=1883 RepID=UPI00224CE7C2|nr:fumarylacetoacetate hydrolase family protein [Streptomyces sp. NBC_00268]MCX5188818.1 fumarylacetoacetate hydrolase family protein [Streptomyces sp. NBC_00268]
MRLATIRTPNGLQAVRIDGDVAVECGAPDVGALLARADWRDSAVNADGPRHDVDALVYAPVVPSPGKIICVGLNYRTHITEMGRDLPQYPTLFAKFPEVLIGPYDALVLPAESDAVDWEAELAVVIGTSVRRADEQTARAAIAGYTIMNDVSMRDWQFRTREWLQGKNFEASAPFGPHLVTPDEIPANAAISSTVDGEVMQSSSIGDLLFGPAELVAYISTIITLHPGDVIATGTTGGVGHARTPQRYLQPGQTLVTSIEGIGQAVTPIHGSEKG